ncbi:MAG: type II toxin-antitoxin system RelE/ParE family toxin [Phyllobacteriaceae bacterium]|nr:type II toxin-antitoxin system RelE/ParE family toxin [Phyllobacteriaceae bacterium]
MKTVRYAQDALNDLRRHRSRAALIMEKIARYADTGAGDVKGLAGKVGTRRLRVGDFRVLFEETADSILVTRVVPRGDVYD